MTMTQKCDFLRSPALLRKHGFSLSAALLLGSWGCSSEDELMMAPSREETGGAPGGPSGGSEASGGSDSSDGGSPNTEAGGTSSATGGRELEASGGSVPASGSGGAIQTGGDTASGGTGNTGGASTGNACASIEALPSGPSFSCGSESIVFRDAGQSENRVNYVIVGDGYTEDQLETLYVDHIENMLENEMGMFGDLGEPYRRYEDFINICALYVASQDGCVDDLDTGLECDTAFDGYGDDNSRLGIVDQRKVYSTIGDLLPDSLEVDWVGVTINAGADNWWNSGGPVMVWNGGYDPPERAASVALHEGGHTFHALADEYAGTSQDCNMAPELNVSTDDSGAKWSEWLGFEHNPGTGAHGVFEGARYCNTGVYRPTDNSEMNQLPDRFNMPSMQKMIHDIFEIVSPIDAHTDNKQNLTDAKALQVRVVDPEVIRLEWSVDGMVQSEANDHSCFSLPELSPGEHTIEARAFDETEWVRDDRSDLEQTVTWTVEVSE